MNTQQNAANAQTQHMIKNNGEPMAVGETGMDKRWELTSRVLAAPRRIHGLLRALGVLALQGQTLSAQAQLAVTRITRSADADLGGYSQSKRRSATVGWQLFTGATTFTECEVSLGTRRTAYSCSARPEWQYAGKTEVSVLYRRQESTNLQASKREIAVKRGDKACQELVDSSSLICSTRTWCWMRTLWQGILGWSRRGSRQWLLIGACMAPLAATAAFDATPVSGYWVPSSEYAQYGLPQPTVPAAATEFCRVWILAATGGQLAAGYPFHVEWSSYYWYGPAWQCTNNWSVRDYSIVWTTSYTCPEHASLSGVNQCICDAGYKENATHTGCYEWDTVDILKNSPPPEKPKKCNNPDYGNPIYPLTGTKRETIDTRWSIGGQELALTYDSGLTAVLAVDSAAPRSLGGHWESNLHRKLTKSVAHFGIHIYRGNGRATVFSNQNGVYAPADGGADQLSAVSGGFRYVDVDNQVVETYNSLGQITGLSDAAGNVLTFTYSAYASGIAPAAGYLMKVTDQTGRSLRFEYVLPLGGVPATDGLISKVINATGQVLALAYDSTRNLATLTWPDSRTRQLLYENLSFPWALTGVVDETGNRYATFGYDNAGRAISTEYAGAVNRYAVTYGLPPDQIVTVVDDTVNKIHYRYHEWVAPSGTSLSTPNGESVGLGASIAAGAPVLTGASQPAGSGCAAANSGSTYDVNGNVLSRDDFQNQRTCFAYGSGGRETARVEGLANTTDCAIVTPVGATLPAGARRTTTSWHPDWRKQIQVVEPLRTATTVYHGQPDPFNGNVTANCTSTANLPNGKPVPVICKQVEQATLGNGSPDPSVAARISTYTYDGNGRIQAATDANGRATSYSYFGDTSFTISPQGDYDASYESVRLLLHGNGVDGQTLVTDDGPERMSLTVVGNTKVSSTQSRFGGTSIAFDGSGDYLSIPYSSAHDFGAGDFTIETYLYKSANNVNGSRIWNPNGDYYDGVALFIDSNGSLAIGLSVQGFRWDYSLSPVIPLANGQWYHLAVVRSGGSVFAYVNGVQYAVTTALGSAALYSNANYPRVIGGQAGIDRALNGYIDDFRITKGVARYTANFTPPTQESPSHGVILSPTDIGHTVGDLQSITNPAGHLTQFTQYDMAGRIRQMIDPKGVVTDISYTPRGWVSTVTTTAPGGAGRTTSYSYDGVGQLTGVTQPDGSTLSYSYDAAHRLVGVTDAKGNSVNYTLDNVGNRINEEIKDPTGTLQRSISRSFDALNRLQQVTGAAR